MKYMTISDLSEILHINKTGIMELVNSNKIPYKIIKVDYRDVVQFVPAEIKQWIPWGACYSMTDKEYLAKFKRDIEKKFPNELKELRKFGDQFTDPIESKGYYLVKVPNKKLGFVYYVKYLNKSKLVPSKWCTHTNNYEFAEKFAIENRERLLEKYYERKIEHKPHIELYSILKKYYAKNSPFLEIAQKRGRQISEKARVNYHNFIIKRFIPYLRKERITEIDQIETPLLSRLQNYLLADKTKGGKIIPGIKPQTINRYLCYISLIFDHLIQEGHIKANPCKSLISLKIKKGDEKETGCYEVDKLKGAFNRKWKNEFSYLLCLIIYTTDMRNSEIERIQVEDFFVIDDVHFLDIPESKSKNGVRIVPIHIFVFRKIMAYVRKNKIGNDDFIFKLPQCKKLGSDIYKAANLELAEYTGYTEEQLEKENIRFYSGRHFWKTLMDSENLGDVEEYFMGHKISADVAKRYNHKDKQGKKMLLERAKKVFAILDKRIFVT